MCVAQIERMQTKNSWGRPSLANLPEQLAGFEEREQNYFLVGGELRKASQQPTFIFSPALVHNKPLYLGSSPDLTPAEAMAALDAAKTAYDRGLGEWPQMSPIARITCLEKFVDQMVGKRDEVSRFIMLETAKPLKDSYAEFDRTVDYINQTITSYKALLEDDSQIQELDGDLKAQISRTPIGVTLCMGPFNYPLNETFTSLIPALLMGNTIIMKPARFGVLLFEPLLKSFQECFPAGVINVIYGDGAKIIDPIMRTGEIDTLAFIGSTKVANLVRSAHPAQHRLTSILGLGAHNAAIVLPGTDVKAILPDLMKGSLTFNGQRCTTLAIHYVHSSQAAEYAKALAKEVSKLKQGNPWEDDVQITPLAEGVSKIDYLQGLIHDAIEEGAKVVNEGGGTTDYGIITPAVLYPVTPKMRIYHEEQFGPIVPIVSYDDPQEVVRAIAKSNLGQQLSIFGEEDEKLWGLVRQAKNIVARVNINAPCQRGPDSLPFTGKKDSGLGVLSIRDALLAFSTPTVIAGNLAA